MATGITHQSPKVVPPLEPGFQPAVLGNRAFSKAAKDNAKGVDVRLALEQSDGSVFHFERRILPLVPDGAANLFYLERLVKFLLWSRGGFRVYFDGPPELGASLRHHFQEAATGRFDAELMGERIYERPFEIVVTENLPPVRQTTKPLGRHWEGCRIGFDLGASDRKVAAVIDGKAVFSDETLWNPVSQADPQWHFDQIMDSLQQASRHLPRVDAIGGSAAGVYVNNRVRVASLFRGVPPDTFQARARNLFVDLRKAWGDIPFEVVNDGEVTALAGSMSLEQNAVLGIAMGSSQAAGFVTPEGTITSWLNELAFAPIDYSLVAPVDEWSGDRGCGVQYFSQQAVSRLMPVAGIECAPHETLPERLKHVQRLMAEGDSRARKIYETIGVCLGYAMAHYTEFYDFKHVLVLGRVTSGPGGEVMVRQAREVLKAEFPELASAIEFHLPGEKEKRHGQAMAAASLPAL